MEKLLKLGFKKVGEWNFEKGALTHTIISNLNESGILYSFVASDKPMYIGKTIKTLSNRMNQYAKPNISQRTNSKVNAKISEYLKSGIPVSIYILVDEANIIYKDYKVSLAAGLEDNLISELKPDWNISGK